jgi:cation transport ATPase
MVVVGERHSIGTARITPVGVSPQRFRGITRPMGRTAAGAASRDDAPEPEQEPREPEREEHPKEKRDRELIELLNELRVALPGVQVLFAFLLTVPFSQRFASLTPEQRGVYFATFLLTALATAMLMTPSAYHRVRFRQADKERLLRIANVAAIAGLVFLILAVTGCVFLIADVLFNAFSAWIIALILAGGYGTLWFVLPLTRRLREAVDDDGSGG